MSDVKSKADHLTEVITDRYEAASLEKVADRLHHRLIEVGWDLPAGQFYATREGSSYKLEFLLAEPVDYLESYRRAGGDNAVEALSHIPMCTELKDLPPFAGFIVTGEAWALRGIFRESLAAEALHPIWRGSLQLHPDRVEARRTLWATPDLKSGMFFTHRNDSPAETGSFVTRASKNLGVVAGALNELINSGQEFNCTSWKENDGD